MYTNRRNKVSLYRRFEKWFYSNHKKEIETSICVIMELLAMVALFGSLFFLPALFH